MPTRPLCALLALALLAGCGSPSPGFDTGPGDGAPADAGSDIANDTTGFDVPGRPDVIRDVNNPDAQDVPPPLDADPTTPCSPPCTGSSRCRYGVCVPDLGTCRSNDDCPGDSYCDTDGRCTPYGIPASHTNDPACRRANTVDRIVPTVQCEWRAQRASDPAPDDPAAAPYTDIYTTPVVADLNLDGDPNVIAPSIVVTTFDITTTIERRGMLRVFDGRTCQEQMNIGRPDGPFSDGTEPGYGSQIAIGDLDGDVSVVGGRAVGHPEIVTFHRGATGFPRVANVIAYHVVDQPGMTPPWRLERAWIGRNCGMAGEPAVNFGSSLNNHGPSIADLDDDGHPEVLVDRYVFSSTGCVLNPTTGSSYPYIGHGLFAVVADVDSDGELELVRYDGVYRWDRAAHDWVLESYWAPTPAERTMLAAGNVAVADFGNYPAPAGIPSGARVPEIAVVSAQYPTEFDPTSSGTVRMQTITGHIIFAPQRIYAAATNPAGHGGAPTAADFDGDGLPEFAAAANEFYTVYDPDCVTTPDPVARPGGRCARPAGGVTAPGVLWARASRDYTSSSTGSSVFDFDGDGTAEVVYRDECYLRVYRGATGEVIYSSPATSGTNFEYPVIADVDGDFSTEIVVPRTRGTAGCPTTDPIAPAGLPAVPFTEGTGFVILRDPMDRWAASRPIWNQHVYTVTNVLDNAVIPRTSATTRNWDVAGLNNFRQNVQGAAMGSTQLADLTVAFADFADLCSGGPTLQLRARVCNRGTNPVPDGAPVRFVLPGLDGGANRTLCEARTTRLLNVGECVEVMCGANVSATESRSVIVTIDPDGTIADCHTGNNRGIIPADSCPG